MSVPAARTFTRSTGVIGGIAVTASAAPLLLLLPGAEERLVVQASKWGPRWNRGFAHMAPRIEHHAAKVEPHIQRNVQKVEPPLKRAAIAVDRNIKWALKK